MNIPQRFHAFLLMALVTLSASVTAAQGADVDTSPLRLRAKRAFPELRFRRPIVLTHAGDGTNRVFVAEQQGVIRVFNNDQEAEETTVFLDHESKVAYKDEQNEEGLLGLAFHPQYKQNGHFFLYYTTRDTPLTSVISRFTVSKNDPQKADPKSEVELLRITQPFWNHNGGTLAFGPDGHLYIALGDGGKANDPFSNGQNLETLLGSILRIDVDHKDPEKNYAIPKDNPFAGRGKKARPEIWAYGVRNIWRMSFDRETGLCWAGDVGQDLWEEINIIKKGGNYGWNLREGKHKFGPGGVGPSKDFVEPIFEYHHDIGKSITGGHVYRGKRLPELVGAYVYADYVAGNVWALRYDAAKKQVTANQIIESDKLPVMSFGEDQEGEIYYTTPFGILYHFVKAGK